MSFVNRICIVLIGGMTPMSYLSVAAQEISRLETSPLETSPLETSRRGMVSEPPRLGASISTPRGYMVAYDERIPGTDIQFQMVPIPGGRFLLGSPHSEHGRRDAEGPQASIFVEPFWMGVHEVTWKEFRIYMGLQQASRDLYRRSKARIRGDDHRLDAVTAPSEIYDTSYSYKGGEGPDTPAVTMTHQAAKQYTKWLSLLLDDFYRLPSEAEWEYACRAGTSTAYSFGDDASKLVDFAWFTGNAGEQRHEVGGKLPNPWGLYDMHGNAAEWVLDSFSAEARSTVEGGAVSSADNIRWPTDFYSRIAKGGSWELEANACRSAARLASSVAWSEEDPELPRSAWWHTSFAATGVGFRLIRPLAVPKTAIERERFWRPDHKRIESNVDNRIEESKGIRGIVRPDFPQVIYPLGDMNP